MGQAEDEPIQCNLLHPGANQRNTLPEKKEPVVPVLQSTEDEIQSAFVVRLVRIHDEFAVEWESSHERKNLPLF